MAYQKKYAGLTDLDAAPEIYETPDLTDDVSTVQTDGHSETASENGRPDPEIGLDRQRLDRDEARRRFETSRVDARGVNFSDSIEGNRRSYKTARRRRRRVNSGEEYGDFSDSDDESLSQKLVRLRREAEELRQEIERREEEQFEDATEEQGESLEDGVTELTKMLNGLDTPRTASGGFPAEALLSKRLAAGSSQLLGVPRSVSAEAPQQTTNSETATASTLPAISAFSDRLVALESALGISSSSTSLPHDASSDTLSPAILPTVVSLHNQIQALSSALLPGTNEEGIPTSARTSPLPTLDALATRIRTLTTEADKLGASRKAALECLKQLHDTRLKDRTHLRTYSSHSQHNTTPKDTMGPKELRQEAIAAHESRHESQLFLDELSSRINALYTLIPTIQSLTPLLPTVLSRLRSLQHVHAGAATAANDLEVVVVRQGDVQAEICKWREGLGAVEKKMGEVEGVMSGNVEEMGALVAGLEKRIAALSR